MNEHEQDQPAGFPGAEFAVPEIQFEPDPELENQGWERRFMAVPEQIEDTLRLYSELGFEVRQEPVRPKEMSELCGDCRLAVCNTYVTIYTRKQAIKHMKKT